VRFHPSIFTAVFFGFRFSRSRILQRGEVIPIEPGRHLRFTGLEPSLLRELSMPCANDDNYFENPAIPFWWKLSG
jgi:hypothetical protein